jgi:hypothetical protein
MRSLLTVAALIVLYSPEVRADCNLPLVKATANYLWELEKAKLQKYQDPKPCEVLDAEFKRCSDKQKSGVEKALNMSQILGNICMPHLPPPKP